MAYPISAKTIDNERKAEIYKELMDYLKMLKLKIALMEQVKPLLESMEGKAITKRIKTTFESAFPLNHISYRIGVVDIELGIWGNGIDYDNIINFRLCRIGEPDKVIRNDYIFQYDWFNYQIQYDKLLAFTKKLNWHVVAWNETIDFLNKQAETFSNIPYPASKTFYMRDLIR